jgi:uncharacterized lipoprotein
MFMKKWLVLGVAVVLLSGCATQRIYTQAELGGTTPAYEKSQPFFLWGIGQTQDLNAAEACGQRTISRIETAQTATDVILQWLTIGIYSPRTVQVYCR